MGREQPQGDFSIAVRALDHVLIILSCLEYVNTPAGLRQDDPTYNPAQSQVNPKSC